MQMATGPRTRVWIVSLTCNMRTRILLWESLWYQDHVSSPEKMFDTLVRTYWIKHFYLRYRVVCLNYHNNPAWYKNMSVLVIKVKLMWYAFADKGLSSQSYGFSSSHVWMWDLAHKESWALKNWCFWTAVLEKTLESSLGFKEIKPVHPKGNQSWIFIGRTHAEGETPILWPSDAKNWLIGKDPDAEKDWGQEKGMTEDEMVGWHHWLNGHGFGYTLAIGDGQGGLACCGSWGRKESDTTERLNWTDGTGCQYLSKIYIA